MQGIHSQSGSCYIYRIYGKYNYYKIFRFIIDAEIHFMVDRPMFISI